MMCGQAYLTSARIAESTGPFPGYAKNEEPFLEVIRMHRDAVHGINHRNIPSDMYQAAKKCWEEAYELGKEAGFRNGADHRDRAHRHHRIHDGLRYDRHRAGSGAGEIQEAGRRRRDQDRQQHRAAALIKLGYTPEQVEAIVSHIDSTGTIEGAPGLKNEHLPVFDCSFRPQNGTRSIHYMGHLKMMGAVQPFISGRDLEDHQHAGRVHGGRHHGRVYRELAAGAESGGDLSRQFEEGSAAEFGSGKGEKKAAAAAAAKEVAAVTEKIVYRPVRRKLPDERQSITHKFSIGGHEGYITVGMFDDGTPGEIFITMAKEGSTISGLMDSFATSISYCLQYGVPLKFLVDKFGHVRFEPSGWTGNQQHSVCEVDSGLYFPLAGGEVPGTGICGERSGRSPELRPTEDESAGIAAVSQR